MTYSDHMISIVEAANRLDLDDREWLALVARAISPVLPHGAAQLGFLYQESGPGHFRVTHVVQRRPTTMFTPAVHTGGLLPSGDTELAQRVLSGSSCSTVSSLGSAVYARWERSRGLAPFEDALLMTARGGTRAGMGIAVCFPYRSRATAPAMRCWQRVAAHVAAALRIREQLSHGLVTDGAPVDALKAICDSEAGPYPSSSFNGVDIWRDLSRGRYSLVEHFDQRERHYFVLRRNADDLTDPRALTGREAEILELAARGDTDRTIAEHLGISNSTVATHRARGMEKLGIKSRALLGHFISQMGAAHHA